MYKITEDETKKDAMSTEKTAAPKPLPHGTSSPRKLTVKRGHTSRRQSLLKKLESPGSGKVVPTSPASRTRNKDNVGNAFKPTHARHTSLPARSNVFPRLANGTARMNASSKLAARTRRLSSVRPTSSPTKGRSIKAGFAPRRNSTASVQTKTVLPHSTFPTHATKKTTFSGRNIGAANQNGKKTKSSQGRERSLRRESVSFGIHKGTPGHSLASPKARKTTSGHASNKPSLDRSKTFGPEKSKKNTASRSLTEKISKSGSFTENRKRKGKKEEGPVDSHLMCKVISENRKRSQKEGLLESSASPPRINEKVLREMFHKRWETMTTAWRVLDTNNDGKMSLEEFRWGLEQSGFGFVNEETQRELFKKADVDHSGFVTFKEFKCGFEQWLKGGESKDDNDNDKAEEMRSPNSLEPNQPLSETKSVPCGNDKAGEASPVDVQALTEAKEKALKRVKELEDEALTAEEKRQHQWDELRKEEKKQEARYSELKKQYDLLLKGASEMETREKQLRARNEELTESRNKMKEELQGLEYKHREESLKVLDLQNQIATLEFTQMGNEQVIKEAEEIKKRNEQLQEQLATCQSRLTDSEKVAGQLELRIAVADQERSELEVDVQRSKEAENEWKKRATEVMGQLTLCHDKLELLQQRCLERSEVKSDEGDDDSEIGILREEASHWKRLCSTLAEKMRRYEGDSSNDSDSETASLQRSSQARIERDVGGAGGPGAHRGLSRLRHTSPEISNTEHDGRHAIPKENTFGGQSLSTYGASEYTENEVGRSDGEREAKRGGVNHVGSSGEQPHQYGELAADARELQGSAAVEADVDDARAPLHHILENPRPEDVNTRAEHRNWSSYRDTKRLLANAADVILRQRMAGNNGPSSQSFDSQGHDISPRTTIEKGKVGARSENGMTSNVDTALKRKHDDMEDYEDIFFSSRENTRDVSAKDNFFLPSRVVTEDNGVKSEDWALADDFVRPRLSRNNPRYSNLNPVVSNRSLISDMKNQHRQPVALQLDDLRMTFFYKIASLLIGIPHFSFGAQLALTSRLLWEAANSFGISGGRQHANALNAGIVVEMIGVGFLMSAAATAGLSLRISNQVGRRTTFIISAIASILGAYGLIALPSLSPTTILIARAISGGGLGLALGVGPVYYSEFVAMRVIEKFTPSSYASICVSLGITLALGVSYFTKDVNSLLHFAGLPHCIQLIGGLCVLKESPWWLLERQNIQAAFESLRCTISSPEGSSSRSDLLRFLVEDIKEENNKCQIQEEIGSKNFSLKCILTRVAIVLLQAVGAVPLVMYLLSIISGDLKNLSNFSVSLLSATLGLANLLGNFASLVSRSGYARSIIWSICAGLGCTSTLLLLSLSISHYLKGTTLQVPLYVTALILFNFLHGLGFGWVEWPMLLKSLSPRTTHQTLSVSLFASAVFSCGYVYFRCIAFPVYTQLAYASMSLLALLAHLYLRSHGSIERGNGNKSVIVETDIEDASSAKRLTS